MPAKIKRLAVTIGLIILGVAIAHAQDRLATNNRGKLTLLGKVSDSTGAPIPDVRISVTGTGIDETITDELGNYVLPQLAEDLYIVTVEGYGFLSDIKSIQLTAEATAPLDFTVIVPVTGGGISTNFSPRVVRKTTSDRLALQIWLNSSMDGLPITSVIPLETGASLFVFGPDGRSSQYNMVRIVAVSGAFDVDSLSRQLRLYPNRTFIGVHRPTDSAYFLFLR